MKINQIYKDKLKVKICEDGEHLAKVAAISVVRVLNKVIERKGNANLILATGASQFSFLKYIQQQKIDWKKITVFHLDERKAEAVYNTLNAEISEKCPATILRKHPNTVMYLDNFSSLKLKEK